MKLSTGFILAAFHIFSLARAIPTEGSRLLQLAQDAEPVWHTEAEVLEFIRKDVNFVSSQSIFVGRWLPGYIHS